MRTSRLRQKCAAESHWMSFPKYGFGILVNKTFGNYIFRHRSSKLLAFLAWLSLRKKIKFSGTSVRRREKVLETFVFIFSSPQPPASFSVTNLRAPHVYSATSKGFNNILRQCEVKFKKKCSRFLKDLRDENEGIFFNFAVSENKTDATCTNMIPRIVS